MNFEPQILLDNKKREEQKDMLVKHPFKMFEMVNACDYAHKSVHAGEFIATHKVVVVYGKNFGGGADCDVLELCQRCADNVRADALNHGYDVDVMLIGAKSKVIKQINNLKIKYNADMGQYQVYTLDKVCLEEFMTQIAAERFCVETKDYVFIR